MTVDLETEQVGPRTWTLVLRHPGARPMKSFDILLTPTNRVVASP